MFTPAAATFQAYFGRPCPAARPVAETVDRLTPNIVAFRDPPGVFGQALPSGGSNPANAVMTYYPRNPNGSWLSDCLLPAGEKDVCTTALNAFLLWYGQR